jgi:FkbM family methyltransferase
LIVDTRRVFLKLLRTFEIDTVCDVGSLDGSDALRFRRALPAADVIAFEPNPRNFDLMATDERLPRHGIRIFPFAVSDRDAEAPFFVVGAQYARNRDVQRRGISSLHRRADSSSIAEVVQVRTVRLDDVLSKDSSGARIALWIDTEGMAFEAIAGASRVLGRTRMLHVEAETVPCIGAGQKLLPDIERILAPDFVLLATDHPREWSQLNALFVRRDSLRAHAAEIRAVLASERLRHRVASAVRPLVPGRLRRFLSRNSHAVRR